MAADGSPHYLIFCFVALLFRAASVAASVVGSQDGSRRGRLVIWPEFQEADMNAEKWVSFIIKAYW